MHANLNLERNDWRVPVDETVQVLDPKSKKIQGLYRNNGSLSLKKNWRAAVLALAVISIVLVAVLVAVLFLGAEDQSVTWLRVPYDLSDILDETPTTRAMDKTKHAYWLSSSGSRLAYWDSLGGISLLDVENNRSVNLLAAPLLRQWQTEDFCLSPCGRFLLLKQKNAEFNSGNRHAVYDIQQNFLVQLKISNETSEASLLQRVVWLPKQPSSLVVVERNNIYLVDNITDNNQHWTNLAFVKNQHLYTHAKQQDSPWTSPDSRWIVFPRFDTTHLTDLFHINYEQNGVSLERTSYSKPGSPVPVVKLIAKNVENVDSDEVAITHSVEKLNGTAEYYLSQVQWLNSKSFLVTWLHRSHSSLIIDFCQEPHFICQKIYSEQTASKQRLQLPEIFASSRERNGFLYIARSFYETQNKGQLLYFHEAERKAAFLHHKEISINEIVGWNEGESTVYVTGKPVNYQLQQHVYSISYSNPNSTVLSCLTCDLVDEGCAYADAKFDPTAKYYALYCQGPDLPSVIVKRVNDSVTFGQLFAINDSVQRELLLQLTPRRKEFYFPLPDGVEARIQIQLPLAWKDSGHYKRSFPLIIEIPDQDTESLPSGKWKRDWSTYLAVTHQVIYAQINGRERSARFGSIIHAKEDVYAFLTHIVNRLTHIDTDRVAIIGTGTGGYITLAALANDRQHQFSCGIAVSPVVDWTVHEAASTESLLGTFESNYENYVNMKLDDAVSNIKNDTLLLVDPFSRDPLHLIHSMKLSKLLVEAGVRFKQQIYPDANIDAVRYHAYNTMEEFLDRCLDD